MAESEKNQREKVYEILVSQFKDARDRTEYLNDKAHNLLGFDGITNSILIALVVLIVKDESTRDFIANSSYYKVLNFFIIVGFSCYILSTIFAIISYKVAKYKRAPAIGDMDFIKGIYEGGTKLNMRILANQVLEATEYTDDINKVKYDRLMIATLFLLTAIVSTAILGVLLFISIV